MRKTLLMTTALVALTCGHNAYAQISDDININQDTVINDNGIGGAFCVRQCLCGKSSGGRVQFDVGKLCC